MQETHLAVAVALSSSLHRKFLHYRGIHHQASSFQESTLMSFTAMTINRLIAERDKAHAENERLCRELTTSIESERLALRNNEGLRRELAEARGLLQRIRNDLAAAYWHEYIDAFLTAADQPEDEPSCGECYGIGIHFDHCSKADKSRGDT
jgi:hypothetical protein